MTPKASTHFRLSQATVEKLAALAARYGSRTRAIKVAIDRLYYPDTMVVHESASGDQISWLGPGLYAPIAIGQPYQHIEWYPVLSDADARAKHLGTPMQWDTPAWPIK